jgi:WD40 repeat protein
MIHAGVRGPVCARWNALRETRPDAARGVLAGSIVCLSLFGFALLGSQKVGQAADDRSNTRLVEAHLALERAMNHFQRDEIAQGLVWLAHGLEVVPEDEAELQLSFRRLLRAWSRHIHPLKRILPIPSNLNDLQIALTPDGKLLATGRDKPAGVQLSDASTGKALGKPISLPGIPWHVAFVPQGTLLLTACYDESGERNSIRFWDAATRRPIAEPILLPEVKGDDRSRDHLALSPDGKRLLTFHDRKREGDCATRLWEVPKGKPIGDVLTMDRVRTAVFSPDGKTLLTAGDEVRCWDGRTGKPLGTPFLRSATFTTTVAVSPDSKHFLTATSGSSDERPLSTLRIFETATRQLLSEYSQQGAWTIDQVAFGPDGRSVLVWYWDATCTKPVSPAIPPAVCPLLQMFRYESGWKVVGSPLPARLTFAFNGDGRAVLLVNDLWEPRLWDTQTGQPLGGILETGLAQWVGSDPGGKTMLTASGTDIRRWEITLPPTGRKLEWSGDAGFGSLTFSPDGKKIAMTVVQGGRSEVRFWDPVTAKLTGETIPFSDGKRQVFYAAYSPDGRVLVTVDASYPPNESDPATARLWTSTTRQLIGEPIPVQWGAVYWKSRTSTLAFSPDGKRLLLAQGKLARLFDTATGKPTGKPMKHGNVVRAVAFSPDGQRIVTGGDDNTARLWDAATGQPVGEAMKHPSAVTLVVFSPDGSKVLTDEVQTARLWNAATGQAIGQPIRHGTPIVRYPVKAGFPLNFSRDGKALLLATPNTGGGKHWGAVRLWDTETGKPLGRYLHQGAQIIGLAFSPDGRTIMTAGSGTYGTGGVKLWDVATGRPLGKVLWTQWDGIIPAADVRSAVFSPDSRTLLATAAFSDTRRNRYFTEARLFEVPQPLKSDATRLRLWIEVITARELDAGGELADLDAKTWQQRWQQLQKLGGPPSD